MQKFIRSPLFLMALTIFIDFTGFGLVIPLLPFWAEHVGAGPVGVGLVVTVYAFAQFLFTPILGQLSDRYGRRPIILISLLIEACSFAFTALAGTLPLLLLARFIGGLGASNIGSAQAVISDITSAKDRAKGMGLIGAAIGLGFVFGPAIGGALAPLGQTLPFWVAMIVALLNAILVALFLPETRQNRAQATGQNKGIAVLLAGWQHVVRYPVILRLVGINLLFTVAFTAMETTFPLFTQHTYGWGAIQNGYIFTYIGILVVLMQGGLVGQLVKRFGEHTLLIGGLAFLAAGLGLLPWSTQLALLLIALALLSIGDGAVNPIVSTILSFASPREAQGEILGFAQGMGGLGRIVGPLLAGSLYASGGPGTPLLMGAVLALLGLLIALPGLPVPSKSNEAVTETTMREHRQKTRPITGH